MGVCVTVGTEIWIVDDDEAVRDSLAILLELGGFGVRCFGSGEALFGVDIRSLRLPSPGSWHARHGRL